MEFLVKETYAEKKEEKLTAKDRKLIQLLVQNGRASVSELSKKIGISKPAISNKIQALKDKGIILNYVLYNDVRLEDKPMYLLEINTPFGAETQEISSKIIKIKGISIALWYNGTYNLFVGIFHEDPQKIAEEINKVVSINKIRIKRVSRNWYHPPHIFEEVNDSKTTITHESPKIEKLDKRILDYLSKNPRAKLIEISEETKSSPLTIKKRIEKMKKEKAIIGISAYPNPWKIGKDIISVSFSVKGRKNTDDMLKKILESPQTGNVWEFEHEWNINAVLWVKDQAEVNKLLEKIHSCKGILDTEIEMLSGIAGR